MPRGNTNADIDRRDLMKYLGAGGAAALAGCGGGGDDGSDPTTEGDGQDTTDGEAEGPVMGGRFTLGRRNDAQTLNPLRISDGSTSDRVYQLMDGGLARQTEEDIAPYWFESWELSDSLDVVDVKLRENLSFGSYEGTDYGDLTADTYLENISELFTGWYPYTYAYNYTVGGEEISFSKEGEYSIRMELPSPQPLWYFKSGMKFSLVVPETIIDRYAENQNVEGLDEDPEVVNCRFNGNLGPWDLNRWSRQSIIVFDRNDDWYLRDADMSAFEPGPQAEDYTEAPYFDQFAFQVFNSDNTIRQALRTGQIQQAGISVQRVDSFEEDPNTKVTRDPFVSYSSYMGLNQRANGWEPLRNQEVRYAMANLYNRNFVVENVIEGEGEVQGTLHPGWGPYYPDDIKEFDWSVETAQDLLESGTGSDYGYDSGGTFRGPEGEQVDLTLVYQPGTLDDLRAQYIADRFGEAGINVQYETQSFGAILRNFFAVTQPAEGFEQGEIGYGPDNSQHPGQYNYGPRDRAVGRNPWDLMITLGFSYGPYDPTGTVAALLDKRGAFNAYGHVPDVDVSYADARDRISAITDQEELRSETRELLRLCGEDQPLVFESNPIGYTATYETVQGPNTSGEVGSYFGGFEYNQLWYENGQSPQ